jgi:2-oxoglutarate dehydrogenase complex dehydrogenase (E1) component-like enzyme
VEELRLATPLRYVGRVASASPATGNASVHKKELETLLSEAFAQ